jgi:hypothetical protein
MVLLSTGEELLLLILVVYYYVSSVADQDLVESGIFKKIIYLPGKGPAVG